MTLKLFEMFAGFGGASFALKKAGVDFECVGFSEIDKFAVQCYHQNHGALIYGSNILENYGDCTKIDPNDLADFDLLTGGFPCQSFSVAGKGLGELDTRGTLFNEIIRIAEVKKPKFMLLENVKGLTNKCHKATFEKILSELNRIGYAVEWELLNSKENGIPQNRERVFFVCFRTREAGMLDKITKKFMNFTFPEKEELKIFLKDILEDEVDEKYYLSEKQMDDLIFKSDHSNSRVYDVDGISPTLNTMQGGHRQPFILIKNATKKGYIKGYCGDGVNLEHPNSKTRRGRIIKHCCSTLQCNDGRGVIEKDMRIRKLTPTECFRLMGFLDDNIFLEGLSNNQRYKLAGNGWDINLVSKLFKKMLVIK